MHDARRTQTPARGGIPDGLLVALLAFLLGLAVLVWTATGLAALFAKGSWPDTVTFTRTPEAVRALIAQPHDVPGAWPDTAAESLPGWGLFWGLFVSQLLVMFVLAVFAIGVIARTKSRRALARQDARAAGAAAPATTAVPAGAAQDSVPHQAPPPPKPRAYEPATAVQEPVSPAYGPVPPAPAAREGLGPRQPAPAPQPHAPTTAAAPATGAPATGAPLTAPAPVTARLVAAPAHAADRTAAPADEAYRHGFGYAPAAATPPTLATRRMAYADPAERHHLAARAIAAAEGAVLVVTSSPALWAETKDARAKLGPVLLYDPHHLCDTPARMHWNPAEGCADRDTAAARATALLAPVRPQARMDAAVADAAETLLRSWLQAAALDSRPFKQLHRWTQGTNAQEPVRVLRTHPQAASGAAGELESALTAHPERRELAQNLTARALSCLSSIHIREACNPNRTDSLTLASFLDEGGSLYVVGEPVEDPRTHPGAMPLLTALASHVVEHGRRMAARSSHGRLDPPLSLVLDDVAAVAPVPRLPELLADGPLPLLALCRSREQARSRWPHAELP
ncbi:type VI secretion protein [Streptomyces sp. NPDC058655]|uniref:type VI secretion protein n=1 Tax=Streptomyces sp. NPDC058655 TaxID=3346577 RepID=UPI003655C222